MTYVRNDKEVNHMPGRDGTGPAGLGPLTGRGFGNCSGATIAKYGAGLGLGLGLGLACRHGFRGGLRGGSYANKTTSGRTRKEQLREQRDLLKSRLETIDKQLEDQ